MRDCLYNVIWERLVTRHGENRSVQLSVGKHFVVSAHASTELVYILCFNFSMSNEYISKVLLIKNKTRVQTELKLHVLCKLCLKLANTNSCIQSKAIIAPQ